MHCVSRCDGSSSVHYEGESLQAKDHLTTHHARDGFLPVPHMTSEVPDSITFTPRRNVRLEADAAADV